MSALLNNVGGLPVFQRAAANLQRISSLAREANAEIAADRAERTAAYRQALARADWLFEFSDDAAGWRLGHKAMARLREDRDELDADGAIWNEYAPAHYRVTSGAAALAPTRSERAVDAIAQRMGAQLPGARS